MHLKKESRLRRSKKLRAKAKELKVVRLCVNRTPRHMYAQLIDENNKVLAAASTLEAEIKSKLKSSGNVKAAEIIGDLIAERGMALDVKKVVFDRSGFSYHGRVSALAEAARKKGLSF
jgi:large subunit ribosomal protein L18